MPERLRWKRFLATYLKIFVPMGLLAGMVVWFVYHQAVFNTMTLIRAEQMGHVDLSSSLLLQDLPVVVSDLHYLARMPESRAALFSKDSQETAHLTKQVIGFAATHAQYMQVRFLTTDGKEYLRVDRQKPGEGENGVRLISAAALQDKSHRPYFSIAMMLKPGEVYISPLDLNMENGVIETPWRPVMRFATQVLDPSGAPMAVAVLNLDANQVLQRFRRGIEGPMGAADTGPSAQRMEAYLVTGDGHWIVGPSPEMEWGDVLLERAEFALAEQRPDLWQEIENNEAGFVPAPDGHYCFRQISPVKQAHRRSAPSAGAAFNRSMEETFHWHVISFMPRRQINMQLAPLHWRYGTVGMAFSFFLLVGSGLLAWATESGRVSRRELRVANESLSNTVRVLQRNTAEIGLVVEMVDYLQACATLDELFQVVHQFGEALLPSGRGVLYLRRHSAEQYEAHVHWGGMAGAPPIIEEEDCWALRRNRIHAVEAEGISTCCTHAAKQGDAASMCIPLSAGGESVGVLHFPVDKDDTGEDSRHGRSLEDWGALLSGFAEHIALSIMNVRLREELHSQSIRDALTGLFNRRYMEETLQRELHRAERTGAPVSVVMFDVDHFKQCNDSYGHEMGDFVLAELGRMTMRTVRAEDVACRYGGEEFLLILPGAAAATARERAEEFRGLVEGHAFRHRGTEMGVTVSLGVAAFPEHGQTADVVTAAADAALYRSKQSGRNCVHVASGEDEVQPHEAQPGVVRG